MDKSPFRLTYQRKVILEELKNLGNHPTVDELYLSVKKRLPRISMSTVYRGLEVLSKNGFIKKLEPIDTQKRFDSNVNDHFNFYCTNYGKVEDVLMMDESELLKKIEAVEREIERSGAYEVKGYNLEFFGVCKKSKSKK
jgi:Fur family ferric uptake transcriptional regulator